MEYLDFDVLVGVGRRRTFAVDVVNSPAGEARETMHFPFDTLALDNHLLAVENALLRSSGTAGPSRRMSTPAEQLVEEFGRALFDFLFGGAVRGCYDGSRREAERQGKGLRLKLRIHAPELAALPWEFLYDPRDSNFICLSRATSLVRYLDLPEPIRSFTMVPPLRVLGLVASPRDLERLDVDGEKQRVEAAVEALRGRGLVELKWVPGQTWRDVQRAMRQGPWHVFHFIGHGGFDPIRDEGVVALVDEKTGDADHVTAAQLAQLLADHFSLRLVLLNACEGARGSKRDIFSSTAAALVRKKMPAVLAMQHEITDRAAVEFARTFYEAIADGMNLDAAVAEARNGVSFSIKRTFEWATPVLFTRFADGVLFDIKVALGAARVDRPAPQTAAAHPASSQVCEESVAATHGPSAALASMRLVPACASIFGLGETRELPSFYIDTYPVTHGEFLHFIEATSADPPLTWERGKFPLEQADHPVTGVSWRVALAYATWCGKRLPSCQEWEKAARGTDGRRYPWGNTFDTNRCNTQEGRLGGTSSVGQYPLGASPYGVLDMSGNVWEWTTDEVAPRGLGATGTKRIVKGGAWSSPKASAECGSQISVWPHEQREDIGFRCVRPE